MLRTGTATKIRNDLVWYRALPPGESCANCNCHGDGRELLARLEPGSDCQPGEAVIVESRAVWTAVPALVWLLLGLGGAVAAWLLSPPSPTHQAALALGGLLAGSLAAMAVLAPLRRHTLPRARTVRLNLVKPGASA